MPHVIHNSLEAIQDETRCLVEQGLINRKQPIYKLFGYFPAHEWWHIERQLEQHDFLLRDQIGDLIASVEWPED